MSSMAWRLDGSAIATMREEPCARDRDDLVAHADVLRDQLEDLLVDLVLAEVDGLNAVLLTEELGDLLIGDEPHLRECVAEADPVLSLGVLGVAELLEADSLGADQQLTKAVTHGGKISHPLWGSAFR